VWNRSEWACLPLAHSDPCSSQIYGTIVLVIKATASDTAVLEAAQRLFKEVGVMWCDEM
jgi:hypothetical protein